MMNTGNCLTKAEIKSEYFINVVIRSQMDIIISLFTCG